MHLTDAHFPGFKGPMEVRGESLESRPLPATQLGIRRRLLFESQDKIDKCYQVFQS